MVAARADTSSWTKTRRPLPCARPKRRAGWRSSCWANARPTTEPGTRALIAPRFLDIHRITDTHEHIGLIYWARPGTGALTLAPAEHHDIRWCSSEALDHLKPPMSGAVKWYCRKALEEVGSCQAARE